MRFAALVLFSICLSSFSGYSQNDIRSGSSEAGAPSREAQRIQLLKADILEEIKNSPNKDRADFYTRLGAVYWRVDERGEGLLWLTRGVELATNPATEYENDVDKLTAFGSLLSAVIERDAALSAKLITKIREIEIDESNAELRASANKTYIVIAQQLLTRKKDDNLALEFAILSLKGPKPAINWNAAEFFRPLKAKNENLANIYFAKLVESVKNSLDREAAEDFVNYFALDGLSNYPTQDARFRISDAQKKDLLEILIPLIQKDSDDFISKKINDCGIPSIWGRSFSEDYKKLLPEKSPLVEQAIAACSAREKETWEKTELYKKPDKTIGELVELAKQIPNQRIRTNYLLSAVSKARKEKKWNLANEILNGIDQDFRDHIWITFKIETVSNLVALHFNGKASAEVTKSLDESPELRPFIIVRSLFWLTPSSDRREEVLKLLNLARADFNKLERYPENPWSSSTNPTHFAALLPYYVKFRFYEEAVAAQEEAVKAFNRLVENLPSEFRKKNAIPLLSSLSSFSNQFPRNDSEFIDRHFERIYANIKQIGHARIRLMEKLDLLSRILEKPPEFPSIPVYRQP